MLSAMSTVGFEAYRALRRELEEGVLQISSSIDGRTFSIQASLHGLDLEVGGYVVVETDAGPLLGQVLELGINVVEGPEFELPSEGDRVARAQVHIRGASGSGVVLDGPGRRSTTARCGAPLPPRSRRGSSAPRRRARSSRSASSRSRRGSASRSTRAASGATRSCAGSRARGRRTRSA